MAKRFHYYRYDNAYYRAPAGGGIDAIRDPGEWSPYPRPDFPNGDTTAPTYYGMRVSKKEAEAEEYAENGSSREYPWTDLDGTDPKEKISQEDWIRRFKAAAWTPEKSERVFAAIEETGARLLKEFNEEEARITKAAEAERIKKGES